MPPIFTIGHSNQHIETFCDLIASYRVSLVVDIRSSPFSAHVPQFNRQPLEKSLKDRGIAYLFEGDRLGARPSDPNLYVDNRVCFERVAATTVFRTAIAEVSAKSVTASVVLMCSEAEPLDCPRSLLIGRSLVAQGCEVQHIRSSGEAEPQQDLELRLMRLTKQDEPDLFGNKLSLDRAYELQEKRIAYKWVDR